MNKSNEARLNMYDAVIAYCNTNPGLITTIPAFQSAFVNFQATVGGIHDLMSQEAEVITGIAADKLQARINLCQLAANLSAAVFAYASALDNNQLKESVNFSISELKRFKNESLIPVCINIQNAADANMGSLADYGITAATLTVFQNAMDAYSAIIASPRNAVSQRAYSSKAITGLFTQANKILTAQLDKTVLQFRSTNPDFYEIYKNNRVIIDPGTSNTQIAGVVSSSANALPVEGATVQLIGTPLTGTTDETGNFVLRSTPIGKHSIKIIKTGFTDNVTDDILVKLGKTAVVNVAINPAAA